MSDISDARPGDYLHCAGLRWRVTAVTPRRIIGHAVDSHGSDLCRSGKWVRSSGEGVGVMLGRATLETPEALAVLRAREKWRAERDAEARRAAELDRRLSDCVTLIKQIRGDATRIERLMMFVLDLVGDCGDKA